MVNSELLLVFLGSANSLVIGYLGYLSLMSILSDAGVQSFLGSSRVKTNAFRFYECATYSRLTYLSPSSMFFLSLMVGFLIYDVDLMLLVSEIFYLSDYSIVDFLILGIFIVCLILGLLFDYKKVGFTWFLF